MPGPADPISTVVVQRDAIVNTIAITPGSIPNIVVKAMSPLAIVLVRAARVYLQTAVGLVTATPVLKDLVPAAAALGSWKVALSMAIGPALVCAAQNTIELLARVDEKMPQMRP